MQHVATKSPNRQAFHIAAVVTHASRPAVQITPNSGPYGTVTVVTGQGFAPLEQVAIYKGTRPFFAYNTDANGSFIGNPHLLMGPGPLSGIIPKPALSSL